MRAGALPASIVIGLLAGLLSPVALAGQPASPPRSAVIDTVIVQTEDVFTPEQERSAFVFRFMNGLRLHTRPWVVRREVLLRKGEPYDSVRGAETERNLRALLLFREVKIDTLRRDGRLAAVVRTRDSWSLSPTFTFAAASEGTTTFVLGLSERNVLGTGHLVQGWYRKDVDRTSVDLGGQFNRLFGTPLLVGGLVRLQSDGDDGRWQAGVPFRAFEDRRSVVYGGEAFDGRVLQFRAEETGRDTTEFLRRAFTHRLFAGTAPRASPAGYVRAGGLAEVRREEYMAFGADPAGVPDTVTGLVGAFLEVGRSRYLPLRHFNGFTEEDIDLGTNLWLSAKAAPAALGWERSGVGPRLVARHGARALRDGFLKASLVAGGMFNTAGLDSGRVVLRLTAATRPGHRQAAVLHVGGGVLESPAPGQEFDLGFENPPRSFEPHAFTGTRATWGTLEYRWYPWDEVLNLFGIGFGAFVDWGGAWYPDQEARFGGNVGVGLRFASALTSLAAVNRIDVGWRFGDGVEGDRWVLSFGPGFLF